MFVNNNLVTDAQGDVTGADLNGDGDSLDTGESGLRETTWDHDGDDGEPDATDELPVTKDCNDTRPVQRNDEGFAVNPADESVDEERDQTTGTKPMDGDDTVQWAAAAAGTADTRITVAADGYVIQEFDTETNTIYVMNDDNSDGELDDGSALVVYYDSNDRYNKGADASTYAGFEKALAKGATLHWTIQAAGGSRATNEYTVTPE